MDVMGGKITVSLKESTKIEKEETRAHQKRARSTLSRERTLELQQWYATTWECLVRLDRSHKSELSQNKTLLYSKSRKVLNGVVGVQKRKENYYCGYLNVTFTLNYTLHFPLICVVCVRVCSKDNFSFFMYTDPTLKLQNTKFAFLNVGKCYV